MKRRIVIILIVVGVLAALLAYGQLASPELKTSGYVEADEIRLGSEVGGRVAAVLVEEGARIKKGQVLIQLEPFDWLEKEKEAQATLAARQAELDRLKAGLRPQEVGQAKARFDQLQARYVLLKEGPRKEEIEAAQARVEAAKAELKLAKGRYQRVLRLSQNRGASREDLDFAQQQLHAAQAIEVVRQKEAEVLRLGTRQEELDEAKARLEESRLAWELAKQGYRDEEKAEAQAARDAAAAALSGLVARKKELEIRSTVHGVVEALELRPGDLVGAGAPVISIINDRRLWVRAYAPLNRTRLQLGDILQVKIDGFPEESFRGQVEFIARQGEFTPRNVQTPEERGKQVFRIKVKLLEESPKQLAPVRVGMSVDIYLTPLEDSAANPAEGAAQLLEGPSP